jgi:hypothetical protein
VGPGIGLDDVKKRKIFPLGRAHIETQGARAGPGRAGQGRAGRHSTQSNSGTQSERVTCVSMCARPYRDSNSVPSAVEPVASRYTD